MAANDNPHATWLMIDPGHGFAPSDWQGGVGDCLVVRADKEPLDMDTLSAITDYISDILDAFGDGFNGAEVAQKYYSRERLDRFIHDHQIMQDGYDAFEYDGEMRP